MQRLGKAQALRVFILYVALLSCDMFHLYVLLFSTAHFGLFPLVFVQDASHVPESFGVFAKENGIVGRRAGQKWMKQFHPKGETFQLNHVV